MTTLNSEIEHYHKSVPLRSQCAPSGHRKCELVPPQRSDIQREGALQGRRGTMQPAPSRPTRMSNHALDAATPEMSKSEGSITDVDLHERRRPTGIWTAGSSPILSRQFAESEREMRGSLTLGSSQRYPAWSELKSRSAPYT